MLNLALHYPPFGAEIPCPQCGALIPALTLMDTYLCDRHGAFEVSPDTLDLVHVQSQRIWRRWNDRWYRQHNHPDGLRFEIHDALDCLYREGYRATQITIAQRYKPLLLPYFEKTLAQKPDQPNSLRLYGLPVTFSTHPDNDPQWQVINFHLDKIAQPVTSQP